MENMIIDDKTYRDIMSDSSKSVWLEDFTEVYYLFNQLKNKGIEITGDFFDENPYFLQYCIDTIRVIDVNEATLRLYKANDKAQLLGGLGNVFVEESLKAFKMIMLKTAKGNPNIRCEAVNRDLEGKRIDAILECKSVICDCETTGLVVVTIQDKSTLKRVG
jgi:hypothetical protein